MNIENKKSILIVDDNLLVLKIFKNYFKDFNVFTSSNIAHSKEIINNNNIDVIICDGNIDDFNDGLLFLDSIEKHNPKIKRILYTGDDNLNNKNHQRIRKPISILEIRNFIKTII